jgi:sugar/nucleoside kinase (ribokinase family)
MALGVSKHKSDEEFVNELFGAINTDVLVIHRTKDALAYDGAVFEKCDTFFCKEPKILTGGGDNFNAGFCFAQLIGLDMFQSLVVSNSVSGYYVKTGISPDVDSLVEFLGKKRRQDARDLQG